MLVGINGFEANVAHRVGVGQYAYELITRLSQTKTPDVAFRIYLQNAPPPDMPAATPSLSYRVLPGASLWTLTRLQRQLVSERAKGISPDVFFTPTHYTPLLLPMPSVISVMDLSVERYPQFFKKKDLYQLKYWTRLSVNQARKVLTISEFSKKEITSLYHQPSEKIVVTYPGYDSDRFNAKVKNSQPKINLTLQRYKIRSPYFLYLGTLQPRKNLVRLVEAFSALPAHLTLVIAGMITEGRGGWMYQEIFDKVKQLGLDDRVIFTGYVPDNDVPFLLAGSLAYVLPSLYEGFGIPPVEAMATGTPVVVSKVTSLPEICGNAAVYIHDPYDAGSIKSALAQVLNMKAGELVKRTNYGLRWVKRYNWETTAKKTLATLIEAANR